MSNKKFVRSMVVCSLLAGMSSVPVFAADAGDQVFDLGEFIVTATRTKTATVDVAADTKVISAERLEDGNYNTVSEALKANDVAVIQKGAASYPIINGDNRVMVLVNGRKMNFNHLLVSGASNAIDIDKIPMENVARIEVVKGPNSSLYGEKAVAGVINIITKAPEEGLSVRTNAEFGSWNYRKGGIAIDGGNADTRFSIGYTKEIRDNYDYKSPSGRKIEFTDSSINRETLTARVDQKINSDDRLTFDVSRTRKNDGYGLYVADVNVGRAYYNGGTQVGTDWSYGVQYTFGAESQGDGTFIRAYQNKEKSDSGFDTIYNHNLTYSALEGQKVFDLSDKNTLTAGVTLSHEKIKENNGSTPADVVAMDRSQTSQAVYVEDTHRFGRGWSLNSGLRYERYNTIGGDFTGHVGINKKLSDDTHAYLSFGTAVNNPTLKMMYADTQFWKGNEDLKQEKSNTITLGVDSKVNDKLSLSASAFSSHLKDALDWQAGMFPDGRGGYVNVSRENRKGISLAANYKINQDWSLHANYSYTNIKKKASSNGEYVKDLDFNFPQQLNVNLTYKHGKWLAEGMVNFVKGRSYERFNSASYATVDMNVNYQMSAATKFYVKGFNLTDKSYQVEARSSFYGVIPMPGRHFMAGVEHRF